MIADLEQMLEKNCPKFVSGAVSDLDNLEEVSASLSYEPVRRQVSTFIKQATQHVGLSNIRSFLKLYTSIEMSKIAKFNHSKEDEFRSELISAKHLMSQMTSSSDSVGPLSGEVECALDLLFYVKGNVIHCDDTSQNAKSSSGQELRHESFFMSEIARNESLVKQTKLATLKYVNKQAELASSNANKQYNYDD